MTQHVRIAMPAQPYEKFSAREFATMLDLGAFEDMRVELVEGEFEKMAPAGGDHGTANFSIALKLHQALGQAGATIATDLAVQIDANTVRGLDIAVGAKPFRKGIAIGEDVLLAVEIAETTLSRDLGSKAAHYARAGIPHYWVVDLNARVVHVMSNPSVDGYAQRSVVRFGEPLAVPGTSETITL